MLRKIKLYGKLAKFIGRRVLEADVATAAEAVRFLVVNWPKVEAHMADQHYRVSVGSYDLDADELHHPAGAAPISFVPVVIGGGGLGKVLAGIALIALSFVPFIGATLAPIALGLGVSLALGGVAELLSPVPTVPLGRDRDDDPRKSYSFSGVQNTGRQGVPVPIVYGETLVGSVVISAGIDTVEVK